MSKIDKKEEPWLWATLTLVILAFLAGETFGWVRDYFSLNSQKKKLEELKDSGPPDKWIAQCVEDFMKAGGEIKLPDDRTMTTLFSVGGKEYYIHCEDNGGNESKCELTSNTLPPK